ncbi:MAG TPA: radical SAM protein [Euryarchaeota archaeon]|nr:radical SAM protein [Euryarchaeota archaeon]
MNRQRPESIRLSLGTAILLGLRKAPLDAPPTTAYLMVGDHCINNCSFCTQARDSSSRSDLLSRVTWPSFDYEEVMFAMERAADRGILRICLQCLNDPSFLPLLPEIIRDLKVKTALPVSVSIGPTGDGMVKRLKEAGAERMGIALDGASEEVFERIKGSKVGNPYTWKGTWEALERAVKIFGRGKISTHIIVGMGETDRDVLDTLLRARELGILVSLFSYTPMKGTRFRGEQPPLERYRALQLARHAIMGGAGGEIFRTDEKGKLVEMDVERIVAMAGSIDAFRTRGCPDCNRPYYNERPGGPMYNYPGPVDMERFRMGLDDARSYMLE